MKQTDCYDLLRTYEYIEQNHKSPGFPYSLLSVIDNKETDTQAYYFSRYPDPGCTGPLRIMAFPGTRSWRDFLTDICLIKKVVPYGNEKSPIRIHSGFLDAYKSIRASVTLVRPDVILGHSLGGALAQLYAIDMQYRFGWCGDLLTYGSPRVGNDAFAESFEKRVTNNLRFTNFGDVIPTVPVIGYRHAGKPTKVWGSWGHLVPAYLKSVLAWISG